MVPTSIGRARTLAARAGRAALDALLPPRCIACDEAVAAQGQLCAACWRRLRFIEPPHCACCGVPFDYDPGDGARCAACLASPPPYRHARAVLVYDDGSRELLLPLKHADRTDAAPTYGAWMARAGAALFADADLVVPVPLHRRRLFARRYNQSALLAAAVARASGCRAVPDLLRRTRHTPPQGGLNANQRAANVRGAFQVRADRKPLVRDRGVVLVDDVLTTGATAAACVHGLLRAGAAHVDVLTLARVVRAGAETI